MWKQEPNFNMATSEAGRSLERQAFQRPLRVSKAWEVATKETITEIAVWLEREAEWNRMTEMMYYSSPQDSD
jgi:hypothetical protein